MTRVFGVFGAVLLLALAVTGWQLQSARNALADVRLTTARLGAVTAAARVDTVRERLAGAVRTVTRTIASVRVDTLIVRPTTPAETLVVVRQAPAVVAALDSTQRACTAVVTDCLAFRAAAESRFAADSVVRVQLEGALRTATPSRWRAAYERVRLPLAFGLGVFVGARAVR